MNIFTILAISAPAICLAAEIEVGAGRNYLRIEKALEAAQAGDTITVHPLPEGKSYPQVALYVTKPGLTIRAADPARRVVLSGKGFDYSGRGSIPRAIVQFNRGADNCRLEGLELTGAHNGSHNGAGVRINQANGVIVSNCEIHGNDMGIMSNGDGTPDTGRNQLIELCLIHNNGTLKDPGYNHNLYLGGESVTLRNCEVHSSLTGHNVKSRAHRTVLQACHIHDSANREVDLVDHKDDTARVNSDAFIIDCVIVKDIHCRGNRAVIHFGEDVGGDHNGTLHLVNSTIVTPFISPVVQLSAPQADARIYNNIICDGGAGQRDQVIFRHAEKVKTPKPVFLSHNWLSHGFPGSTAARGDLPPFTDPARGDYTIKGGREAFTGAQMEIPAEIAEILKKRN